MLYKTDKPIEQIDCSFSEANGDILFGISWARQKFIQQLTPVEAGLKDDFRASLKNICAFSPRDWSLDREDAWIYGIVSGWGESLTEVAQQHKWSDETTARLKRLHEQFNNSAAQYAADQAGIQQEREKIWNVTEDWTLDFLQGYEILHPDQFGIARAYKDDPKRKELQSKILKGE